MWRPLPCLDLGQTMGLAMNISCRHLILTQFANFTRSSVLVQIMVVIEVSGLVILSPDFELNNLHSPASQSVCQSVRLLLLTASQRHASLQHQPHCTGSVPSYLVIFTDQFLPILVKHCQSVVQNCYLWCGWTRDRISFKVYCKST